MGIIGHKLDLSQGTGPVVKGDGSVPVLPPMLLAVFLLYFFLQCLTYLLFKAPRILRTSCLLVLALVKAQLGDTSKRKFVL